MRKTHAILIAAALWPPRLARADDEVHRDRGLTHHAVALAADVSGIDLGSGTVSGWGGVIAGALGGGRFQATADGAFGKISRTLDDERLGLYARGTIGARMLVATLSSRDDRFIDLVVDAGAGVVDYLMDDGVAVHHPIAYAGWGLRFGYRARKGHGGGLLFDMRLAMAPRDDDPDVARLVCKGTCTSPDTSAVDVSMIVMFGATAW